ncbi:MAG: hypothetical protein L0Y72_07270 [Gemmataceae bacterium]|nr:hypothetical protein [Gemmataceae bacterium]MCI0738827.1 hypothetical protein [Gemmataceae bacterium]
MGKVRLAAVLVSVLLTMPAAAQAPKLNFAPFAPTEIAPPPPLPMGDLGQPTQQGRGESMQLPPAGPPPRASLGAPTAEPPAMPLPAGQADPRLVGFPAATMDAQSAPHSLMPPALPIPVEMHRPTSSTAASLPLMVDSRVMPGQVIHSTLPWPAGFSAVQRPAGEGLLKPCSHCQGPALCPDGTCCRRPETCFDNTSLFFGLDGYKEPADLGINGNFGFRVGFNTGFAILEDMGLGAQVGTAINYSRTALRLLSAIDGTQEHIQSYTTLGIFQRGAGGINWGVAYDLRFDDYYGNFETSQWRGQVGYEIGACDEIGLWGTLRERGDRAGIGGVRFDLQPINQVNFYWRHIWENNIVTRAWIGIANEHSRFVLINPGHPPVQHPLTFGGDFFVPLSDNLALFGEAHFITPNDTGSITATLGLVWYPGTARDQPRNRFAPLLPLANNPSFALDVR